MLSISDLATSSTAEFVASHVPAGSTIVEVGCGAGEVASLLSRQGYQIVGIDSDADAVAQARALGVKAVHASWRDFEYELADSVIFTRSLHHISPLAEAVARARASLGPEGVLLIEDFAFSEISQSAVDWLVESVRLHDGETLLTIDPNEFARELLETGHEHNLHSFDEMQQAIEQNFVIREVHRVPYLYRYLIELLPESVQAATFLAHMFMDESRCGAANEIPLIGRRIVAYPSHT